MSIKIRRFRSGGWEADIRITLSNGKRYRERKKAPVSTKTQAKEWARDRECYLLKNGIEQEQQHQQVMPTLAEFLPRFMVSYCEADRLKPSTIDSKQSNFKNHLAEPLGNLPIDQIRLEHFQQIKARMAQLSPKTVNNTLSDLNTMLKVAFELRILKSPAPQAKLLRVPPTKMRFYEREDFEALVDSAKRLGPMVYAMVLLGGEAGLRRGEMIALQQDDLDFRQGSIFIERSEWKGKVREPKSGRRREVPMTQRLRKALKPLLDLSMRRVLWHGDRDQVTAKIIRSWMSDAQRLARLRANGGVHILRHTFCSHLAMEGANARAIQKLAGHADLNTTMRYMHLAETGLKDAIRCLEPQKEEPPRGDIVETGRLLVLKT